MRLTWLDNADWQLFCDAFAVPLDREPYRLVTVDAAGANGAQRCRRFTGIFQFEYATRGPLLETVVKQNTGRNCPHAEAHHQG